ncbi:hypothetical protein MKW98_024261, partial [Papaver atlanticum]
MHKLQVGIAFDRVFFLQLAGEKISLEDIECADPIMYKSCKKILEMDADFVDSDAMGLTFVREIEEFGSRKIVELCPGGNNIVVNSKNREQYVHLLIQHFFVKSVSAKVAYFARGFADILCKRRLAKGFFRRIGLKGLDCALLGGHNPICLKDWKEHTKYEGYRETDEQICWFWKVVMGMSMEQQRELLFFWTSVKYLQAVVLDFCETPPATGSCGRLVPLKVDMFFLMQMEGDICLVHLKINEPSILDSLTKTSGSSGYSRFLKVSGRSLCSYSILEGSRLKEPSRICFMSWITLNLKCTDNGGHVRSRSEPSLGFKVDAVLYFTSSYFATFWYDYVGVTEFSFYYVRGF